MKNFLLATFILLLVAFFEILPAKADFETPTFKVQSPPIAEVGHKNVNVIFLVENPTTKVVTFTSQLCFQTKGWGGGFFPISPPPVGTEYGGYTYPSYWSACLQWSGVVYPNSTITLVMPTNTGDEVGTWLFSFGTYQFGSSEPKSWDIPLTLVRSEDIPRKTYYLPLIGR